MSTLCHIGIETSAFNFLILILILILRTVDLSFCEFKDQLILRFYMEMKNLYVAHFKTYKMHKWLIYLKNNLHVGKWKNKAKSDKM